MAQYKLTYFDFYGKGEIIRLLFALADVQYEDVRLERFGTQWPALKESTPFGQIPTLEVDGVTLCQSIAIARFLARKYGLAGKTALDEARADMIVGCLGDLTSVLQGIAKAENEQKRAELKKKGVEETLPVMLRNLEKILRQNKQGEGFFVGDEITWADVAYIDTCQRFPRLGIDLIDTIPKLKALYDRVVNNPRLAAYLARRPVHPK